MPDPSDSGTRDEKALAAAGSKLCLACGLCCRGAFFVNTIDPKEFGFDRPSRTGPSRKQSPPGCRLHIDNKCAIYNHPRKPIFCSEWECRLLKKLKAGEVSLESAMRAVTRIVRLYEKVALSVPSDNAQPVFKQALEVWEKHKESGTLDGLKIDQILDIVSFLRLADRYIKPNTPGLFPR